VAERAASLVRAAMGCALAAATLAAASVGCDRKKAPPTEASPEAAAPSASAAQAAPTMPMNALPIPSASVAAALNPDKLPPYQGPTGSVEGTISVTGDEPPRSDASFSKCPGGESTYGHAFRAGAAVGSGRALGDAVVGVTGYTGFYIPEKNEVHTVTARECAFETRTVTMTFGQRLEVVNRTADVLSPVLEPSPRPVVMIAIPGGDPVKLYLPKPGRYRLSSRERPWMKADVYAFLQPLYTASRADGTYRIDGVPVGKLRVSTTHPTFGGEASKEVEIQPGVVAKVDLVLEYVAPPPAAPVDAGTDAPWRPTLR
jgi:hypothetical protein